MWVSFMIMTLERVNYIMWSLHNKVSIFVYSSYIHADTWEFE